MTQAPDQMPQRRKLSTRLQPWVEALYKLIVAMAAALAIWRGWRGW
jgi:hypothetical protein